MIKDKWIKVTLLLSIAFILTLSLPMPAHVCTAVADFEAIQVEAVQADLKSMFISPGIWKTGSAYEHNCSLTASGAGSQTNGHQIEGATGAKQRIEHQVCLKNEGPGAVSSLTLRVALITTRSRYQEVFSTEISPCPYKIIPDEYGNLIAELKFGRIPAGEEKMVKVVYQVALPQQDVCSESRQNSVASEFLQPESFVESDAWDIVALAEQLTKNKSSAYSKARVIYEWIGDNISYTEYNPVDQGALWALQNKAGDCTEFSYLMVALCRAAGIPARFVEGLTYVSGITQTSYGLKHDWVEIYLPDNGWVPVDPTRGRFKGKRDDYFATLSGDCLVTTIGNPTAIAELYDQFHYFEYYYRWDTQKAKVSYIEEWCI